MKALRSLVDRVGRFLGLEEGWDEEHDEDEEVAEGGADRKRGAKVVSLHSLGQGKVVICEPQAFDDAQGIADHLKNRRTVVVNFTSSSAEVAKRVMDFVSGLVYALEGDMQKVCEGIFLVAPNNVDVSSEAKEKLSEQTFSKF